MGKARMKMKKIENISARQVTFSKRRQGLVKKAHELSVLCEAQVAVMVFSPTKRYYQYSSFNIDDILYKFALQLESERQPAYSSQEQNKNHANLSKGAQDKIDLLREIKTQHLQNFAVEELDLLEMKLEGILQNVTTKKQKLLMNDAPALQIKEVHTTCTSGTQSKDSSYSAQDSLSTIAKTNPREDGFQYSHVEITAQSGSANYPERWIPPPGGVYKVNFAGTNLQNVDASGVGVAVGVVVRNWKGDFMAAIAKFDPELVDVSTASWMAAKCAIEFAVDYHFTHIMLEGDVPDTIMGLQYTYKDNSPASTIIIQEAKRYMAQLGSCFFSHVQLSGNTAAHMVAQHARNFGEELVWLMEEPDFLLDTLLADVAGVQTNY